MTDKVIRILLVEDNPGDVVLIRKMLPESAHLSFKVSATEYLNQALDQLKINPYDMVILDLSLPDSQGMDTFTRLHGQFPDNPIVVVTGLMNEEIGTHAVRMGAQDYLVKGRFDQDLLIRALRYAIERRAAEEELRRTNRAMKVITACNEAMVRATEESELLSSICRNMVELGGYRMAWVGYAESDENKTVQPVAQAGFEEGYLESINVTWADTHRGQGPTGRAIQTGQHYVCTNCHLGGHRLYVCGYASRNR
jgi:DNA-binding response OmpR family regulator